MSDRKGRKKVLPSGARRGQGGIADVAYVREGVRCSKECRRGEANSALI